MRKFGHSLRWALIKAAVAGTTMVALAFLIPLGLMVQQTARDRSFTAAERQAAALGPALAITTNQDAIARAVASTDAGAQGRMAVHLPPPEGASGGASGAGTAAPGGASSAGTAAPGVRRASRPPVRAAVRAVPRVAVRAVPRPGRGRPGGGRGAGRGRAVRRCDHRRVPRAGRRRVQRP